MGVMKNDRKLTDAAMNEVTGGTFWENCDFPHCKLCDEEVECIKYGRLEGRDDQYRCKNRLCQNCINRKILGEMDIYWAPSA